ncbi:MAG: VIT1/CCC1 transporter family protein [Acidimicrobiia bacterium]
MDDHPAQGHVEHHRSHRAGWLRAAVLGANDGLLSTAGLLVGVASGNASNSVIVLTGLASLAAGGLSMAIGEYGSVSSQLDAELADLAIEQRALDDEPDVEVAELATIYRARGLSADLAMQVAEALHEADALGAHARDELGLDPEALAKPLEAAVVSAGSFSIGAAIPIATMGLLGDSLQTPVTVTITMIGMFVLGAVGAKLGGARPWRAGVRIFVLGGLAMAATSIIGKLVGVDV